VFSLLYSATRDSSLVVLVVVVEGVGGTVGLTIGDIAARDWSALEKVVVEGEGEVSLRAPARKEGDVEEVDREPPEEDEVESGRRLCVSISSKGNPDADSSVSSSPSSNMEVVLGVVVVVAVVVVVGSGLVAEGFREAVACLVRIVSPGETVVVVVVGEL